MIPRRSSKSTSSRHRISLLKNIRTRVIVAVVLFALWIVDSSALQSGSIPSTSSLIRKMIGSHEQRSEAMRVIRRPHGVSTRRSSVGNTKPMMRQTSLATRMSVTDTSSSIFQKKNIPNFLTSLRVAFVPVFLVTFIMGLRGTTFVIYLLSCITDFFDGYLARKWNISSPFGAFLDPVADKLMVSTALILLTKHFVTLLYIAPVALIMCREIAVSALREWMAEHGQRSIVKVGVIGKWKTTFQMISTSLLLIVFPGHSNDFDLCQLLHWSKAVVFTIGIGMLYLSTALTLWSGWEYFHAASGALFRSVDGSVDEANESTGGVIPSQQSFTEERDVNS